MLAKSAKFLTGLTIILFGFVRMLWLVLWLGVVCAWCMIQLSRSSQASPWLEHQDDVSGLTCIGYRGISELLWILVIGIWDLGWTLVEKAGLNATM